jgi:acyl-CoA synthetase (AMP-forming)/AMP-acid ligase II
VRDPAQPQPPLPEFPTIVHALAHAGYTFLVDRKKEMIIAGGYNV